MTLVLGPRNTKMHSDTKSKARHFALVSNYLELVNSSDDQDCSDVMMGSQDQEVPVSSFCAVKTEMEEEEEEEEEPENVPDTPTILSALSNYLPSDSILHPGYDNNTNTTTTNNNNNNGYNKTTTTIGSTNITYSNIPTYSNSSNRSNHNIPLSVHRECEGQTQHSLTNSAIRKQPQNCFTFASAAISKPNNTQFVNYSQSISPSPKHHQHQIQPSLSSQQSQFWSSSSSPLSSSMSSTSSLSSSVSSIASPSFQRHQMSQNNFSTSSPSSSSLSSSLPSLPTMINSNSLSPAPSRYSSPSPSSLSSSSPLLSSSSSSAIQTTTPNATTNKKTFVSELNGSGCTTVISSGGVVPNFLVGNCFTAGSGEADMLMPVRNHEESLEYTDLDKLPEVSFYDDLTSMTPKDQLLVKPSTVTSSLMDDGGMPLEMVVDFMRGAIEHDRKELDLPQNPQYWSPQETSRWVRWVCRKYGVPDISEQLELYTGLSLCSWPSESFVSMYGSSGLKVFEELELWKTANFYNSDDGTTGLTCAPFMDSPQQPFPLSPASSPAPSHVSSNHSNMDSQHVFSSSLENSEDEVFYSDIEIKMETGTTTTMTSTAGSKRHMTDTVTAADLKNNNNNVRNFKGHPFKPRLGRGHKKAITLWQFLLELLVGEQDNSDCIKWLNQDLRIFKIEDSKKVASLWGKVKSRPAMNYDKLSRSVRQYYKKGIIKKPEQTKRLVYQFCPGVC